MALPLLRILTTCVANQEVVGLHRTSTIISFFVKFRAVVWLSGVRTTDLSSNNSSDETLLYGATFRSVQLSCFFPDVVIALSPRVNAIAALCDDHDLTRQDVPTETGSLGVEVGLAAETENNE
ncbi:hypothetical protein BCR37DRAFT_104016 [Protomyces lactucae-debilis]|uniref:Uncharacterized protein n=1 Tax=Protomyces lactucae-debilis TaxID=2754530 RepID=A0A1Y2F834_PROLT|nr:uncharacterized protein BCR37DRAFT_104016 [Protomyces lactucae-debilis]ORY79085.1 hypothetical protein BCR37DRAFT_104016 [Protomyces lactucae-debilis]